MDQGPQHDSQCARSAGAKGGDILPLIVTGKNIFNWAPAEQECQHLRNGISQN